MMTWQAMQRRSKSDVLHFSWSNSCWLYTRIDRTWIRLYLSIFDRDCRPVDTIETFHSQTAHNTAFEVVENIHKTASPMCQFKTTLHTSYCFQCNIGDRPLFSIFISALYFRLHLQPVNYPAAHISFSRSFSRSSLVVLVLCGIHWSACLAMLPSHLLRVSLPKPSPLFSSYLVQRWLLFSFSRNSLLLMSDDVLPVCRRFVILRIQLHYAIENVDFVSKRYTFVVRQVVEVWLMCTHLALWIRHSAVNRRQRPVTDGVNRSFVRTGPPGCLYRVAQKASHCQLINETH